MLIAHSRMRPEPSEKRNEATPRVVGLLCGRLSRRCTASSFFRAVSARAPCAPLGRDWPEDPWLLVPARLAEAVAGIAPGPAGRTAGSLVYRAPGEPAL